LFGVCAKLPDGSAEFWPSLGERKTPI